MFMKLAKRLLWLVDTSACYIVASCYIVACYKAAACYKVDHTNACYKVTHF